MTALEREVADAFHEAARAFRDSWNATTIRDILRTGSVAQMLDSAPYQTISRRLTGLTQPFQSALTLAGRQSVNAGNFTYRFDATDPRTIAYAEAQAARLVTAVTDSTREAIRQTVTDSFIYQRTVDDTARALRDTVGVTSRGAAQLANSYERTFLDAIKGGASEVEARALAQSTRDGLSGRLTESRARTIARTEVLRAENAGRYLGWAQGIEAEEIDPESKKEWIAGDCPICEELDGEVVPWDEPFSIDVDMPPAHPNCVCTAVLMPSDTPTSRSDAEADPETAAIEDEIGDIAAMEVDPEQAFRDEHERLIDGYKVPHIYDFDRDGRPYDAMRRAEEQTRQIGQNIDTEIQRRLSASGYVAPTDIEAAAVKDRFKAASTAFGGSRVRTQDRWVRETQGFDGTHSEWRVAQSRAGTVITPDEVDRMMREWSPEWRAIAGEYDDALAASTDLGRRRQAGADAYRETLRDVLGSVRPMGPPVEGVTFNTAEGLSVRGLTPRGMSAQTRGVYQEQTLEAMSYYPTDWVVASNADGPLTVRNVTAGDKRGWQWSGTGYVDNKPTRVGLVHIPSSRNTDVPLYVHELGHRMEAVNPDIVRLERAFWERRADGETVSSLSSLTGGGYRADEVAVKDKVGNPYMLKRYKEEKAWEVLTMGYEGILRNQWGMLDNDADYRHFILGLLGAA